MRLHREIPRQGALMLSVLLLMSGAAQACKSVKVHIDSMPSYANIYLDGKEGGLAGQIGDGEALRVPEGTHRLLLELEGYKPLEQTVNLAKGQHLTFKLQPESARLDIRPLGINQNSLGGDVFIDGTQVGTVPVKLEVSVGWHIIEVRRLGFLVYIEQVEIKIGEMRQMLVPLFAEQRGVVPFEQRVVVVAPTVGVGALMVSAIAPADVMVDNQPRGAASVLVEGMTSGDHWVELLSHDRKFQPWRHSVKVNAGQQGAIVGKFEADPTVSVSVVPRNISNTYVVTLGQAQSCQMPCTLRALSGRQYISVAGPGSKFFRSEISIPDTPSQVTVQHFTLGCSVAGILLLAYGLPSLIASSVAANDAVNDGRTLDAIGFGTLVFSGATSALSAIATLATIKINRASVERMGQIAALPRPRLRLLASGVTPTVDRTGAIASASFAF